MRLAGARIKLIADGDVEAALATCTQRAESTRSSASAAPPPVEWRRRGAAVRGRRDAGAALATGRRGRGGQRAAGCDLTRASHGGPVRGGGGSVRRLRASPTAARSAASASARAARGAARWSCGSPAARCAASRPSTPGSARAGRPWRARWTKTSTSAYTTRGDAVRSPRARSFPRRETN